MSHPTETPTGPAANGETPDPATAALKRDSGRTKKNAPPPPPPPEPYTIEDVRVDLGKITSQRIQVPIVGIAPLLVHNWSQKARLQLPGGELGGKKGRKKVEHPTADEEFNSARYRIDDDRDGFPAAAFKSAIVDAYKTLEKVQKKDLKVDCFVNGEIATTGSTDHLLVPIESDGPQHVEHIVRINGKGPAGSGTANVRHRAMYFPWSAVLDIQFQLQRLSWSSLLELVQWSGQGGVGEWRPSAPKSNTGEYGRYQIDVDRFAELNDVDHLDAVRLHIESET